MHCVSVSITFWPYKFVVLIEKCQPYSQPQFFSRFFCYKLYLNFENFINLNRFFTAIFLSNIHFSNKSFKEKNEIFYTVFQNVEINAYPSVTVVQQVTHKITSFVATRTARI